MLVRIEKKIELFCCQEMTDKVKDGTIILSKHCKMAFHHYDSCEEIVYEPLRFCPYCGAEIEIEVMQ